MVAMAEVFLESNRIPQAKEYVEQSIAYLKQTPADTMYQTALFIKTRLLMKEKQFVAARTLLKSLLDLNKEYGPLHNRIHYLEMALRLTESENNWGEYREYTQQLLDVMRRLHKQERDLLLTQREVELNYAELEHEKNEAEHQTRIKQLQLNEAQARNRLFVAILISISVVSLLLVTLLIYVTITRSRLRDLSLRDELTGFYNRRGVLESLDNRMLEMGRSIQSLILAIADLDHFKSINDTFGHSTGDKVLQAFAGACDSALRADDIHGRFGGEEWLLVMANMDEKGFALIFERIREQLRKTPVEGLPDDHQVTFSLGGVQFTTKQDRSNLIKKADKALYHCKENGRNQFLLVKSDKMNQV